MTHTPPTARCPRAFTVTELLVVVALIVVLLSILLPALAGVWSTGEMTKSMHRMEQIALWMRSYADDNSEVILPSRFDYSANPYPGKVRSAPSPAMGTTHAGSWSDILATVFETGVYPDATGSMGHDYRFDSPDRPLYDLVGAGAVTDPFRSSAPNSYNAPGLAETDLPLPFGAGAQERGYPGFFAANDFFDLANVGTVAYRQGQIKRPAQSMYLIDSFYGEVIPPTFAAFDMTLDPGESVPDTGQVDFRYSSDSCLMLFLDGHVEPQGVWLDIRDLEGDPANPSLHGRGIRVTNLTSQ
jgi:prepilin-type N-terminal cleavage/methylation domain-containing protein